MKQRHYGWFARALGVPELVDALVELKEEIVGRLDPITNAAAEISLAVDEVAAEVAKIAEQLAGEPTDAEITAAAESLTGIAGRLRETKTSVDALVERAGEDDVAPSPDPETPTTDNT